LRLLIREKKVSIDDSISNWLVHHSLPAAARVGPSRRKSDADGKGRRFATGRAIFRGSPLGDPSNCCIFGHIRHNWPGSAQESDENPDGEGHKHGFGKHRPVFVVMAAEGSNG